MTERQQIHPPRPFTMEDGQTTRKARRWGYYVQDHTTASVSALLSQSAVKHSDAYKIGKHSDTVKRKKPKSAIHMQKYKTVLFDDDVETIIHTVSANTRFRHYRRHTQKVLPRVLYTPRDVITFDAKLALMRAMDLALDSEVENGIKANEFGDYPGISWPTLGRPKYKLSFRPAEGRHYIATPTPTDQTTEETRAVMDCEFFGAKIWRADELKSLRKKLPGELRKFETKITDKSQWTTLNDGSLVHYSNNTSRIPHPRLFHGIGSMQPEFDDVFNNRQTWGLDADKQWQLLEDGDEYKLSDTDAVVVSEEMEKFITMFPANNEGAGYDKGRYRITTSDEPEKELQEWIHWEQFTKQQDGSMFVGRRKVTAEEARTYFPPPESASSDDPLFDYLYPPKRDAGCMRDLIRLVECLPTHIEQCWTLRDGSIAVSQIRPKSKINISRQYTKQDHGNFRARSTVEWHGAEGWIIAEAAQPITNGTPTKYSENTGNYDGNPANRVANRRPGKSLTVFHRREDIPEYNPCNSDVEFVEWYPTGEADDAAFTARKVDYQTNVHMREIKLAAAAPQRMRQNAPAIKRGTRVPIKRWLIDTGCGYDLIEHGDIAKAGLLKIIVQSEDPIRLKTPAGIKDITEEAHIYLPDLEETVTPRVCPTTPNVLSIGRRCMLDGYEFHWEKLSSKPYLVTPSGRKVTLSVQGYIPYLVQKAETNAAPGEAVSDTLDDMLPGNTPRRVKTTFHMINGTVCNATRTLTRYLDVVPGNFCEIEKVIRRVTRDARTNEIIQDVWIDEGRIWKHIEHEATQEESAESDYPDATHDIPTDDDVPVAVPPPPPPFVRDPEEDDDDDTEPELNTDRAPRRNLKEEAKSLKHILTHMPKIPQYCKTCRDAKAQKMAHYNKKSRLEKATGFEDYKTKDLKHFGQSFTLDHVICRNSISQSWHGDEAAVALLDLHTGWRDMIAVKKKSCEETVRAVKEFLGSYELNSNIHAWSDDAPEIRRALIQLQVDHHTSTPGRPQANGRAERNGRHILEGARASLAHSGVPIKLWPFAARHYSLMSNVIPRQGQLKEHTPYYKLHGREFHGQLIPFGSAVKYTPTATGTLSYDKLAQEADIATHVKARSGKQAKFAPPTHHGVFLGYRMQSQGVWSGDYLVAELRNFDKLNFNHGCHAVTGKPLSQVISVHKTRECWMEDQEPRFPLRDASDFAFGTLEGMASCIHFLWDDGNYNRLVDWERLKLADILHADVDTLVNTIHAQGAFKPMEQAPVAPVSDTQDPISETVAEVTLADPEPEDIGSNSNEILLSPFLASMVDDPDRLARARRAVPIRGVVPKFNSEGKYVGDFVDFEYTRYVRDTTRPPHIKGREWTQARPLSLLGAVQRVTWHEEWMNSLIEAEARLFEADGAAQLELDDTVVETSKGPPSQTADLAEIASGSGSTVRQYAEHQGAPAQIQEENLEENHVDKYLYPDESLQGILIRRQLEQWQVKDVPVEVDIAERYIPADIPVPDLLDYTTIPGMPIEITNAPNGNHRVKIPPYQIPFNCCVAEPVSKAEVKADNKRRLNDPGNTNRDPQYKYAKSPQEAIDKEWKRLRDITTWDEHDPKEYVNVQTEAILQGKTVHFGNVFNLCVLKGSELKADDVNRKYKGRTVFQGNRVWDENWDVAMFQELSSTPATMEASKVADFIGLLKGYKTMIADATQAYTQAQIQGDDTYVFLPEEAWTPEFTALVKERGIERPVCKLNLALYGHPTSGAWWEQHCDKHLRNIGWQKIDEDSVWRSCYWKEDDGAFLIVYVDDFKISCKEGAHVKLWQEITTNFTGADGTTTKGIQLDEVTATGKFLGCEHKVMEKPSPITGKICQVMVYDMGDFFNQCVEKYIELAKPINGMTEAQMKPALTPFLTSGTDKNTDHECQGTCGICDAKCLSGNTVGMGAPHNSRDECGPDTGSTSGSEAAVDYGGKLQTIASRILMKVLYGARMARPELLKAVGRLACKVTKWTQQCDAELHRVMCYIKSTPNHQLVGWCNDRLEDLEIVLYADADFASDVDKKSTSGVYMEIVGPDTRFMLAAISKKQSCISHSTPEAEIVAADFALRTEGIPALIVWDKIMRNEAKCKFYEDNETMITVMRTGKNPTMRHIGRTHRVSLGWLSDRFKERWHELVWINTDYQAADIFTKSFTDGGKWNQLLKLIHVVDNADDDKNWILDPHWQADVTRKKDKKAKNAPPPLKADGTQVTSQVAQKKRFQLAMIKKMRRAVESAGAGERTTLTNKQTMRKRQLFDGTPAQTFAELRDDNIVLANVLHDITVLLNQHQKEYLHQRLDADGQGNGTSTPAQGGGNHHTTTRNRAPQHLRQQWRNANDVGHLWDPFTEPIATGKFHHTATTYYDRDGIGWTSRAYTDRYTICREPQLPYDISKVTRRVTTDVNTGCILQDALISSGHIGIQSEQLPAPSFVNKVTKDQCRSSAAVGSVARFKSLKHYRDKRISRINDTAAATSEEEDYSKDTRATVPKLHLYISLPPVQHPKSYICAAADEPHYDRILIEFCCGTDSYIGTRTKYTTGCKMIRLTQEHDMRTEKGLHYAMQILEDPVAQKGNIMVWSAIPCTGGSAWNRYNWFTGTNTTKAGIAKHWIDFKYLWKTFTILAQGILTLGGAVVNEWPRSCAYWHETKVKAFFTHMEFYVSTFDGCQYGLRSALKTYSVEKPSSPEDFMLIQKPWLIAFSKNAKVFGTIFNKTCPNRDPDSDCEHIHTSCSGEDTKLTEKYTWKIAESCHKAFRHFCDKSAPDDIVSHDDVTSFKIHIKKTKAPAITLAIEENNI